MEISGPRETIARARALRRTMTKPERLLWWALRREQTSYRFRKQHPAGRYVLDFYCDAVRLCVEVDGEAHDFTVKRDAARDAWLARMGVRTLRVRAADVMANLEGVVRLIVDEAGKLQPPTAPGSSPGATSP